MSRSRVALFAVLAAIFLSAGVLFLWPSTGVGSSFNEPLNIPEEAPSSFESSTRSFDLNLQTGKTDFGAARSITTWGVNGAYLAPTLRVNKGENVLINVSNNLSEDTTM